MGTDLDQRTQRRSQLALVGAGLVVLLFVSIGLSTRDANLLDGDHLLAHGYELQTRGEADAAAELYRLVLALEPSAAASFNLGVIVDEAGAVAEAARRYEAAIELESDYVPALFNLAVLRDDEGRQDDAIVLYQRVLTLDPSHAGANLNLGILLLQRGDEATASYHIRRALQLDPSLQRLGGGS